VSKPYHTRTRIRKRDYPTCFGTSNPLCTTVFGLIATIAVAQTTKPAESPFSLVLSAKQQVVKAGSHGKVEITLTNTSPRDPGNTFWV